MRSAFNRLIPAALLLGALCLRAAPPAAGAKFTVAGVRVDMMPVPPGTFLMGSKTGESDERNVTRVTISRGFWMSRTEVTQSQWRQVMVRIPAYFTLDFEQPVEQVSWDDAVEFCRLLTEREREAGRLPEGYVYRLPTEAEWEYVCRAGAESDFESKAKRLGWFDDNSGGTTHVVARKQANAWGVCDMHGNVWEWCADWYAPSYRGGAVTDPVGPEQGEMRTRRGGSWWEPAEFTRASFRGRAAEDDRVYNIGFRVVLAPVLSVP